MSLCPEAANRAAMRDNEFWAHVYGEDVRPEPYEYDPTHEAIGPTIATPCLECGAPGACAFDADGRPLIHAVAVDE